MNWCKTVNVHNCKAFSPQNCSVHKAVVMTSSSSQVKLPWDWWLCLLQFGIKADECSNSPQGLAGAVTSCPHYYILITTCVQK